MLKEIRKEVFIIKIRLGHVTNSSSSSFMLAYLPQFEGENDETLERGRENDVIGQIIYNLIFFSDRDTDVGDVIRDESELENYFIENHYISYENMNDDDSIKNAMKVFLKKHPDTHKQYQKVLDLLSKGYYVVLKYIDNNYSHELESIFENLNDKNSVMIIRVD